MSEAAVDQFRDRLALPVDADFSPDPNELRALENKGVSDPNVSLDAAVAAGIKCRLDLANVRGAVDDADRKVAVAADALRAELNLSARPVVTCSRPTRATRFRPRA